MSSVSASTDAEIELFSGVSDSDGLSISGNGDNAKMELKATNENGKTNKVSDFRLSADNVLFIEQNDKVTITDNVDFTRALVTDSNDNEKRIGVSSNGVIDFAGYAQGIYTLDVVVDDSMAYETIIVIGEHDEQVVDREITRVNNKQITEIEIITIFEIEEDNDNNDDNADDGLPYCDLVAQGYKGGCSDRKDGDDINGYPCRDGSKVDNWRDRKDAGEHPDDTLPQQQPCKRGLRLVLWSM